MEAALADTPGGIAWQSQCRLLVAPFWRYFGWRRAESAAHAFVLASLSHYMRGRLCNRRNAGNMVFQAVSISLTEENMSARGLFSLAVCTIFLSSSAVSNSSVDMSVKSGILYSTSVLSGGSAEQQSHPAKEFIQTAQQDVCCPGGYPWYRNSTNTCYGSYEDCHDTDGGGWSCRQVNAC
jgi:hypothetical protein